MSEEEISDEDAKKEAIKQMRTVELSEKKKQKNSSEE